MTADLPPVLLLIISGLVGLVLIPLGLPGLWVILLGIIGYGWLTDFRTLSVWFLGLAIVLAFLGEVLESWIGFRFARRYGGSSRAGWGALVGGLIGVPVPIVGSVIGGFVGAFLGRRCSSTAGSGSREWRRKRDGARCWVTLRRLAVIST
jgi:uncharacterized protein YqgC (DUF456 family)